VRSLGTRGATVTRDHEARETPTGETTEPDPAGAGTTRSNIARGRTLRLKSASTGLSPLTPGFPAITVLGDGRGPLCSGSLSENGPRPARVAVQGKPRRRGHPVRPGGLCGPDLDVQPRRLGSWTVWCVWGRPTTIGVVECRREAFCDPMGRRLRVRRAGRRCEIRSPAHIGIQENLG
jgi:hypothetical protein